MENEKRLLKVGDKLYHKHYSRFSSLDDYYTYRFATVERLTKTQAVLSNGVKLVNTPVNGAGWNEPYINAYCVYGDKWEEYLFETDEARKDSEIQKQRIYIKRWFDEKKFTEEEKSKIYNLLNQPPTHA